MLEPWSSQRRCSRASNPDTVLNSSLPHAKAACSHRASARKPYAVGCHRTLQSEVQNAPARHPPFPQDPFRIATACAASYANVLQTGCELSSVVLGASLTPSYS